MNVVAHNLSAMNAGRQLNITTKAKQKSSEKLSSGYRINRAADDAAGLSISEKMRAQIRGLNQGAENIENGISYVQVADGALEEVHSMLQRINELAVQSANGTNSQSDRKAIDNEVQQLKTEMERVFTTTTFNERQIWDEDAILVTPVASGITQVQAVQVVTPSSQTIVIDNESYDKVACGSYYISADTTGVTVSWTDYDGVEHETDAITWDVLEANNYSFQIADYFNSADDLWDGTDPVFDFKISFDVEPEAEIADIIAAINNTSMSGSSSVWMKGAFEDGLNVKGVSVNSASLNYSAAYASRENATATGYDFEASSDTFLEASVTSADGNLDAIPENNSTSVSVANQSDDTWSFTFDMEGIGTVTATSNQIHYYSPDSSADAENVWWRWEKRTDGTRYRATIHRYPSEQGAGTLGSVMSALTGGANTSTPGLLSKTTQNGATDAGGYIFINFNLTAANAYDYGASSSSTNVGSFTLAVSVTNADTEQSVLDKINGALNSRTILDFQGSSVGSNTYGRQIVYKSSARTAKVDRVVYRQDLAYSKVGLSIHSGPSTRDKIILNYQCLRLASIGLAETNVLTEDNATNAINEVAAAIQMVSKERSLFGAYQNRLEHARAINQNTEENTTAAESGIRDADMADEMVRFSKENILQQAGQAMLAQANQSTQGVLSLLQ